MFRTVPLSIIRSLALYEHTAIGVCHTGYADCLLAGCQHNLYDITIAVYSARLLMMDRETVRNM